MIEKLELNGFLTPENIQKLEDKINEIRDSINAYEEGYKLGWLKAKLDKQMSFSDFPSKHEKQEEKRACYKCKYDNQHSIKESKCAYCKDWSNYKSKEVDKLEEARKTFKELIHYGGYCMYYNVREIINLFEQAIEQITKEKDEYEETSIYLVERNKQFKKEIEQLQQKQPPKEVDKLEEADSCLKDLEECGVVNAEIYDMRDCYLEYIEQITKEKDEINRLYKIEQEYNKNHDGMIDKLYNEIEKLKQQSPPKECIEWLKRYDLSKCAKKLLKYFGVINE